MTRGSDVTRSLLDGVVGTQPALATMCRSGLANRANGVCRSALFLFRSLVCRKTSRESGPRQLWRDDRLDYTARRVGPAFAAGPLSRG